MSSPLAQAVRLLQAGELVAFPTETVYGLGADAANPQAVAKIFAAKGRPADHPLIVHLADASHLAQWAIDIPPTAHALAAAFWPGPLTLILPKAAAVPLAVTGGQQTVGLRVPSHPLALELLHAYAQAGGGQGGLCGIAAPSANRFGRISPTEAAHVREELGSSVSLILEGGRCAVGIESTIIDLTRPEAPPRLLRPGHITPAQIAAVIGVMPETPQRRQTEHAPRVSGSLDAHYAPRTPIRIATTAELAGVLATLHAGGQRAALLAYSAHSATLAAPARCHLPADAEAYAHGFYAALRTLDDTHHHVIVIEALPAQDAWSAIADRLRRAACGAGGQRA